MALDYRCEIGRGEFDPVVTGGTLVTGFLESSHMKNDL